jgi:hypothetical protein
MFIPNTGGTGYITPSGSEVTIAMTNPSGTVTVEQMGVDKDNWFGYVYKGESADLNSGTTANSIYAPIKLKITAVGTGVRLYNRKRPNYTPTVIQN